MGTVSPSRALLGVALRFRSQGSRKVVPSVSPQRFYFHELFSKCTSRNLFQRGFARRRFTTRTRLRNDAPSTTVPHAEPSKSLSQRLKDLSREYGWTAVGVYFALSALDFPFCFLAVRWIGTEKIAALEHSVVEWVKRAFPLQIPPKYRFWEKADAEEQVEQEEFPVYDHGYKEAEQAHAQGASIGTQLALAYAIHKSFIFIRVPLTAAVLPKIVKTLRSWGWKIGKRKPKVDSKSVQPENVKVQP